MYAEIAQNKRRSRLLILCFLLFFLAIGYVFGWAQTHNPQAALGVMGVFGIIAIIYSLISYYGSGSIPLMISHATPIEKRDHPEVYRLTENLCIAAGIPSPKLYLIEDTALNAFATGRDPNHAAIAVTRGLITTLEKPELEGVLAHEISHIRNYDIRIQSLTVALVGLIALLSDIFIRSFLYGNRKNGRKGGGIAIVIGLLLAILSPIIARLIHLAVSREREYLADASGALLTRYPEGLASALKKIQSDHEPLEAANKATAHLYIENPLRNEEGAHWLNGLFSTHPPIEDRIQRLLKTNHEPTTDHA